MKLKKIILFIYLFIGILALQQPSLAEEKIEVIPIIQRSKGLINWSTKRLFNFGTRLILDLVAWKKVIS